MKIRYGLYFFFLLLIAPTSPVWGQATCPALVQSALEATGNACEGIGRNQICYGHTTVELEPYDTNIELPFNAPGDFADVADVQSIRLESMDELFNEWGVALMKLQANIPDTLPGENVTFVLFGDIEIEVAAPTNVEPVTLTITAINDTDIVAEPALEPTVIGLLSQGDELVADGRSRSWIRVQLEDGGTGWVLDDDVTVDGDVSLLEVVRQTPPPPLQAFYLRTGVGDTRCGEAPGSGLLIQTPKGAGAINFTINNVSITLMSTAYIQAQPNGDMTVSVLEGQVRVSVPGEAAVWIPAGAQSVIPLDANGLADGAPGAAVPYGDQAALAETMGLLPTPFEPIPAISDADLETYLDAPLFSDSYGNACVPGGVTVYLQSYNIPDVEYPYTSALGYRNWTVKAGTTVTFTVGGDISLKSNAARSWGYIMLEIPGGDGPFAGAGEATTWSYTFDADMEFSLWSSVWILPGETVTVWMSITCEPPAS